MYCGASAQKRSPHGSILYHSQIESAEIHCVTGKSLRGWMTSGQTSITVSRSTDHGVPRTQSVYANSSSCVSRTVSRCGAAAASFGTMIEIQNAPLDFGPTCAVGSG